MRSGPRAATIVSKREHRIKLQCAYFFFLAKILVRIVIEIVSHPIICRTAAAGSAASTWLHVNYANMLLRSRRSDAPSITNECCTKTGCTWEEYAEYCPSNKRRNHY